MEYCFGRLVQSACFPYRPLDHRYLDVELRGRRLQQWDLNLAISHRRYNVPSSGWRKVEMV